MREVGRAIDRAITWLRFEWDLGGGGFWRSSAGLGTANVVLSLGSVIASVCLDSLCSTSSVMAGKVFDLSSLRVYNFGNVLELLIEDLFVVDVDQWGEVSDRHCDER